jgi:hypothetical protein
MNAYYGPPMTLGNAAAAHVYFIVWCLDCRHRVEPDPAEMAERCGAEMPVQDWHARLCAANAGASALRGSLAEPRDRSSRYVEIG